MKKKLIAALMMVALVAAMTGCGSKKAAADADEGVSGKVVIYTSMYEDIVDDMQKALNEKFPNADIEFFQGGSGTIQSKVAAEMESGRMGCDILMVAEPSYAYELKDQGVLHPFKYSDADKLAFEYDKDGYWYPVRVCNMVLAYNPDMTDKSTIPASFKDFAMDRNMKGQLSMGDPLTSGTAYSTVVALIDKYGEDYLKELAQQNAAVESGSVALTKLETGECKEIMVLEESVLKKRQEEGSTLEVIYPEDGCVLIPSPIMIIDEKHSANNNIAACEAIAEYYLSAEGQQLIINGWMDGVRTDLSIYPYDGKPLSDLLKKSIPVDWDKSYKQRDSIRTLFQDTVTTQ